MVSFTLTNMGQIYPITPSTYKHLYMHKDFDKVETFTFLYILGYFRKGHAISH